MDKADKLKDTLLVVADTIEKQIENEIERLETMTVSDLEQLREDRLNQLKTERERKMKWLKIGHGTYSELPEEKSFFEIMKQSERVIYHFYKENSPRCKIVDKHLKILAPKHVETRFVSLFAPKCPFLAEKLKISVLPTLVIVKDCQVLDKIVGFTDLGNRDDFSTDMLEWRLAVSKGIEYDGDLRKMPEIGKPKRMNLIRKKQKSSIRERDSDSDESDDE